MKLTRSPIDSDLIALLAALCLLLSTVEHMIPKPVPFFRIGLANLPILISLSLLSPKELLLLVMVKTIGQGVINGTLFSYVFLFSTAGGYASGIVMYGSYRLFRGNASLVGLSILGALSSNLVQLGLAGVLLFGRSVLLIAPPQIAVGIASSISLGIVGSVFMERSKWFSRVSEARRG